MSSSIETSKARPYSADVSRMTKVRLQSSNCPTIVKHEVISPGGNMQLYGSPSDRAMLERPRTANNATKMKFAFLQSIRPISSPMSAVSMRPQSGPMNSTINFDFVNSIGKTTSGKFQDKSKIKPMKKLNTDQFHNIIYQVKHQKELLEKDINRMEQWQRNFKENDIWSTPQSAIIESILKMNARANPDGSVSRYLQNEKEKGDTLRNSRKFQQMRPSSAFNMQSSRNIKSVKDFFRNDDHEEEVIDEVLSSKNPYYTQYEANKKRITEKMNAYVDNYNSTDNTLRPSNKDTRLSNQPAPNARENVKNWKPYEVSNQIPQLGEENTGKSISEIVESFEDSENSPANLQRVDKKHSVKHSQDFNTENNANKGRPVSAMVTVNTVISPKNFMPSFNRGITSPPGPLVMHSRPQTAKAMRIKSPGSIITESLAASGEARQPSISGIKYLPFRLEGQRLGIGAENVDVNTYNEIMHTVKSSHSKKASNTLKTSPSAKDVEGFWPGSTTFKVTPTKDFETGRTVSRNGGVRIKSAKKVSRPNTASTSGHETPLALGKVNIDGQYLMNFAENNRTPLANY